MPTADGETVADMITQVRLVTFPLNKSSSGAGHFQYALSTTMTDGSTSKVSGKGALQSTGLIAVWSQGT
jgi:hypothetical protein